ncbi:glycosyltransferase [Candidatus Shapirobacteria bacterium]|nr:glycosyltransferase [Candidatus Shapirobacteria bacterium]
MSPDGGEAIISGRKRMKTLDIIIPVFNESSRLKLTFQALNSFIPPRGIHLNKIIFVNDGSTDNSLSKLKTVHLKYSKKIISYSHNQGKGSAIKLGLSNASADYALFMDTDMSTPLTEFKKFMPYIRQNIPVIIGTRKNGHSTVTVHQSWLREHLGKVFTLLSQLVLNTWVTDFTCGFKLLSRPAYSTIAPLMQIKRWGFDSEIIFLAKIFNFTIQEKSLAWANHPASKVDLFKDIYRSFIELIQIRANHLSGVYQSVYAVK